MAFTSINVIGSASDLVSLYKVSSKTTSELTTTPTITTYTTTQTGVSLASNKTGFIDALVIAGGGGPCQHGGGGGAGGLLVLNSFPLAPGSTYDVLVGSNGGTGTNGGDSSFAGTLAKGGAGGNDGSATPGKSGGSGSGGTNGQPGGSSTQGSGTSAVSSPVLFFSAYGTTATAKGFGNLGSTGEGGAHHGGGGGGAGGTSGNRNGGPGLQLNFTGSLVYYAAGGFGGSYPTNGNGSNGAGWSASGYGMGGGSYQSTIGPAGTSGAVIVRSYNF
jgi:hypothetical protein